MSLCDYFFKPLLRKLQKKQSYTIFQFLISFASLTEFYKLNQSPCIIFFPKQTIERTQLLFVGGGGGGGLGDHINTTTARK